MDNTRIAIHGTLITSNADPIETRKIEDELHAARLKEFPLLAVADVRLRGVPDRYVHIVEYDPSVKERLTCQLIDFYRGSSCRAVVPAGFWNAKPAGSCR